MDRPAPTRELTLSPQQIGGGEGDYVSQCIYSVFQIFKQIIKIKGEARNKTRSKEIEIILAAFSAVIEFLHSASGGT